MIEKIYAYSNEKKYAFLPPPLTATNLLMLLSSSLEKFYILY